MKKLLDLLEQKVQWIVLGLGVLFVLYMAWTYLIVPPVQVKVAGEEKGPGDIDEYINNSVAKDLENKISSGRKLLGKGDMTDFADRFDKDVNYSGQPAEALAAAATWVPGTTLPPQLAQQNQPNQPTQPNQPNQPVNPAQQPRIAQVDHLPAIDAAEIKHLRNGRTNVYPVTGNFDQNNANGMQPVDKNWITVRYQVDLNKLAAAFKEAKLPMLAQQVGQQPAVTTSFLRVVLERQEQLPDGTWGNLAVVPPLPLPQQNQQQPQPQWPAANAPAAQCWPYLSWADQHTSDILQPQFYAYVKGDKWTVPGEAAAAEIPAQQFDPNQFVDLTTPQIESHQPPFTPDQKRAIAAARDKKRQEDAKGKRGSGPPRMGAGGGGFSPPGGYGGGGRGGGPEFGPNDGGRPGGGLPGRTPGGYAPPGGYGGPGGYPGGYGGDPENGFAPAAQANPSFPIPQGEFDPEAEIKKTVVNPGAAANPVPAGTIVCWAHDDTAEPGKTYRYRVTYTVKNPIFQMPQFAKNQQLIATFGIDSKPSEWSEPMEMLSTVAFWIARNVATAGSQSVYMQVFRWQAGETKAKEFKVGPGDVVGTKDGDIDYSTGWTVVDIAKDARGDWYVLMMDPGGNLHKRDPSADPKDPKFEKMKEQANATGAAAAGTPSPGPSIAGAGPGH